MSDVTAEAVEEAYVLSADGQLHHNDVKCVSWFSNDGLFSASRDQTARGMSLLGSGELSPTCTLTGHQAFVNFVMVHPSLPLLDGEPAVITGSNDKHVIVWSTFHGGIEAVLDAHSEGARCGVLLPHCADFVTGGWDKVCIVWDGTSAKPKQVFTGHQSSVLALAVLSGGDTNQGTLVLSSSGDKTVIAWELTTAKTVRIFTGHTDSVQAVVALTADAFASSGNDGMIFLWSVHAPRPVQCLAAHEHLVYALAYHAPSQTLFSASEDHTVKVWQCYPTGKEDSGHTPPSMSARVNPVQVILHPCVVWSVAASPFSSDTARRPTVATGGSDGMVRVWTTDDTLMAPVEKLEALQVAIHNQTVDVKAAASAASGLPDVASMPSVEDLACTRGNHEGERKFCRNGSVVEVYIWGQGSWNKVGVVVAGPNQTPYTGAPQPKEKQYFNGKAFDYVFDVDLEGQSLKLPYNRGQNIFDAAQDFINNNVGVTQDSKEAIVQHILKLIDPSDAGLLGSAAAGTSATNGEAAFSDFARESAALRAQGSQQAQSWGEARQRIEASGRDVAFSTFAQEGLRLQEQQSRKSEHDAAAVPSPDLNPKTFGRYNGEGARALIRELLNCDDGGHAVSICEQAVSGASAVDPQEAIDAAVGLYAMLPDGHKFPAVDLLRLVAQRSDCAHVLMGSNGVESVKEILRSDVTDTDRLVSLRMVSNVLSHGVGAPPCSDGCVLRLLSAIHSVIVGHLRKALRETSAPHRAAAQAVLHNAAVVIYQSTNIECIDGVVQELIKSLLAILAEAVISLDFQNPLVAVLLGYAQLMQASPACGACAKPLVQQFFGPTIRILKSSSDAALRALGEHMSA